MITEQLIHKLIHRSKEEKLVTNTVDLTNSNHQNHSYDHSSDWTDDSTPPITDKEVHIKPSEPTFEVAVVSGGVPAGNGDISPRHVTLDIHTEDGGGGHSHAAQHSQVAARSVILLVALSMDCIFEGIFIYI